MKCKIIILLAVILISACAEKKDIPDYSQNIPEEYASIPLPETRKFDMALSPDFVLKDIKNKYETVMKELALVSDIYFIQKDIIWDFEKGVNITCEEYETGYLGFCRGTLIMLIGKYFKNLKWMRLLFQHTRTWGIL